ncbi:6-hydroxymethylpterin diphosphokinase MptE-like protein [Leadbettera azotonutricia]|uniref:6-hydroxymethylpterin diphosphokinase MptE-like protein n=1 Tax=Leadbettera azotonutricia TaxID=150829 RepID=UPI0005C7408F|nr:6-hydroxymethylpterin diphosphokinase MptE-like protein [Leadbettera azotonutricia]
MNRQYLFERNMLALSGKDASLCSRLSAAETTRGYYRFLESRSGETIPARVDASGSAHPLHSLIDPEREGKRLMETLGNEGLVMLLGLGGGFSAQAALEREETSLVLVIEYNIDSVAELLASKDYVALFQDPRFHLLVDPDPEILEEYILDIYQPVLSGGIRTFPLRARTEYEKEAFIGAGEAVESALEKISADYSVQAYFGTRWFSNVIRNLKKAENSPSPLSPIRRAAVAAAGPSLNIQIPEIKEKRKNFFLIAADTSLPALVTEGIIPDAVVSIDCQHISYYHFMEGLPEETLLFLDLASPPLIASRSKEPHFFSGGHPLTRYISRAWRSFPELDTSGANVTYAALSLAEKLGAQAIEVYGADFSYPSGLSYARGTYIHPYFEIRQNRLSSLESLHSNFLYRSPLEKKIKSDGSWYYETKSLKFYREKLEGKSLLMNPEIIPAMGIGAPINIAAKNRTYAMSRDLSIFSQGPARMKAEKFLALYRQAIEALPPIGKDLKDEEQTILTTLLPAAAAFKRRMPLLKPYELIEETKAWCIKEIDSAL